MASVNCKCFLSVNASVVSRIVRTWYHWNRYWLCFWCCCHLSTIRQVVTVSLWIWPWTNTGWGDAVVGWSDVQLEPERRSEQDTNLSSWELTATLPPIIMVQWKMGVSPTFVSFHLGIVFPFHDDGRKSYMSLPKTGLNRWFSFSQGGIRDRFQRTKTGQKRSQMASSWENLPTGKAGGKAGFLFARIYEDW